MSSQRKTVLANEQIYHVFNRGVERRTIFTNKREYDRALETLKYYQYQNPPVRFSRFFVSDPKNKDKILSQINSDNNKLVEIISFCLMPNHFHLLLKQIAENGISIFLANFTNSYTKYFNTKHQRSGSLVQGPFKAVYIESDEQLIHVSRYMHLNPVASFTIQEQGLLNYKWSSLRGYLNLEESFCSKGIILNQFKSVDQYKDFVFDQISYAKELEKIKHLIIET